MEQELWQAEHLERESLRRCAARCSKLNSAAHAIPRTVMSKEQP
jgi:hypothetical protein